MAVFRVEKTQDFTLMSNHHLRNIKLSLKAKGLLSLMLSLPEDWDYTMKGLAHICKDGVDSIGSVLKELEKHGYLTRQRIRDENGRLREVEYTIHEKPVEEENRNVEPFPPKRENPEQVKPEQAKPILGNPVQLSTKESRTKKSRTKKSFHPSLKAPSEEEEQKKQLSFADTKEKQPMMAQEEYLADREELEESIRNQLEFPVLTAEYGEEEAQEVVCLVADTLSLQGGEIPIGGNKYPAELVKKRFQSLTYEHVCAVMDKLDALADVRNPHAYLRAMLFNAATHTALSISGLFAANDNKT